MGEYAEMMLDGTCCAGCGEFLFDSGAGGIPGYCSPECAPEDFVGRVAGDFVDFGVKPRRAPKKQRKANNNITQIAGNINALNKAVNRDPSSVNLDRLQEQKRRMDGLIQRIRKATQ